MSHRTATEIAGLSTLDSPQLIETIGNPTEGCLPGSDYESPKDLVVRRLLVNWLRPWESQYSALRVI